MAARSAAGSLGAGGIQGEALQYLRDWRNDRHAQTADWLERVSRRLLRVFREGKRRAFSAEPLLAHDGSHRTAATSAGHRASRECAGEFLLLYRSRSTLGEK